MNKITMTRTGNHPTILTIEDDSVTRRLFSQILSRRGYRVLEAENGAVGLERFRHYSPEVVLLDLGLPGLSGSEVLETLRTEAPDLPVIVITGNTQLETAVECMKAGAVDYLVKPVEKNRLLSCVKTVLQLKELRKENLLLKQKFFFQALEHPEAFHPIITKNKKMQSVFHYMEAIAKTTEPVLVTGETGTGKELVARTFHTLSGRKGKFVTVNVGGLDDQMFSDTLFGHKKGAFTDAASARAGFIENAAAGTLFLDEIGDLSMPSQVKLLRLLQEKEYYPLGDDEPSYSDALIIAATNRDLRKLRQEEKFRSDLYYRLDVHHIHLPPLRERPDDLPLLVDNFLEEAAAALGKRKPTPPPELYPLLSTYRFPGNIRELRSVMFKAVSRHKSKMLSLDAIKDHIGQNISMVDDTALSPGYPQWLKLATPDSRELPTLKQSQETLLELAMKRAGNNQSIAARLLGITKQALNKRLKKKTLQ